MEFGRLLTVPERERERGGVGEGVAVEVAAIGTETSSKRLGSAATTWLCRSE